MSRRRVAAPDPAAATTAPTHEVIREREPTRFAPLRTWPAAIARFDSILSSPAVPAKPDSRTKGNGFDASNFTRAVTENLERNGLKKESDTPASDTPAQYNVVMAAEAQFSSAKFFLKKSRHAFGPQNKPKIYVTSHERMHDQARKKRRWMEISVTMLGNDPAYLLDQSSGSSDNDEEYQDDGAVAATSTRRRTPAAPASLTLVPKIPSVRATADETVAEITVREFEQYVEFDGKYYSPFGLYTKEARMADPNWQASAETNNGGTFSERCKMYVYIRHVCSGQSPHDIKTGAQDMRNQAMAATSEERKALGPAERNGYWYEKAASLYASILRT